MQYSLVFAVLFFSYRLFIESERCIVVVGAVAVVKSAKVPIKAIEYMFDLLILNCPSYIL